MNEIIPVSVNIVKSYVLACWAFEIILQLLQFLYRIIMLIEDFLICYLLSYISNLDDNDKFAEL